MYSFYMNYKEIPITLSAIIICVLVWLLQYFYSQKSNNHSFAMKCALIPREVKKGEYYRIITAGFTHIRPYHILMNCIALYNLGSSIEKYLTSPIYGIILFLSIIGSSIACTLLSKEDSMTIGISGGVFGLLATYVIILYKLNLLSDPNISSQIGSVIITNLIISFMPGVSWQGHLGGFITGALLAFFLA